MAELKRDQGFSKPEGLAAFFAAGHDGGVESFAEVVGEIVNLVRTVDLDGFAGGVEDNFAMAALVHMLFNFGLGFSGDGVVDDVVEQGDEFCASHDSALATFGPTCLDPGFL